MALTRQQRDRLKHQMMPIIKQGLEEQVGPVVRQEINRAAGVVDPENPSYERKILDRPAARSVQTRQPGAPGLSAMSNVLLAMANGSGNRLQALAYARDHNMADSVQKTLQASDAEGGGVFVPSVIAEDFIDLLRPRSVVRNAGPQVVENITGSLEFPELTAGVVPNWVGETAKRPTKQPTTGAKTLTARWLSVQVPISMFLQRASTQTNLEQFVSGAIRAKRSGKGRSNRGRYRVAPGHRLIGPAQGPAQLGGGGQQV